jgi:nickel/cobalt transporter (NiCoT) family protein
MNVVAGSTVMRRLVGLMFDNGAMRVGSKIAAIYIGLFAFNGFAWAWAFLAFHDHPVLLGTALLAYTFGLRHAIDADHIAAIDNVTRKLMQQSQRPIGVGLFFSLGHSTVVVLASIAIAATTTVLQAKFGAFKEVGVVVGTSVSALFLFAVAAANVVILIAVHRTFMAVRRGERLVEEEIDLLLAQRGLLGRWLRPLFGLISKSWHMYPLGFLFGLGFDTATEIGVLGISAVQAADALPLWSILVFPALFTAGMSLIDTTDAILMIGAYGWAFIKPIRKLYYNMTITLVSVVIAVLIGGIEVLGLLAGRFGLEGHFWSFIGDLNADFGAIGYLIVGTFVVSWLISIVVYRCNRYDEIEIDMEPCLTSAVERHV